jgi:predicted O-methyltransferase YrrM
MNKITLDYCDLAWSTTDVQVESPWVVDLYNSHDEVQARLSYYRFLHALVRVIKPEFVLEIGVEQGIASAFLLDAAGWVNAEVIGIDLNHSHVAENVLQQRGDYHFIHGNSLDVSTVVEVVKIAANRIGLVFQDSSHHYWESSREFTYYVPHLCNDAVWVCDDVHTAFHDPKVDPPGKSMVDYFKGLPGFDNKRIYPYANGGNAIGVCLL